MEDKAATFIREPEHTARERGLPRLHGHDRSALQGERRRAGTRRSKASSKEIVHQWFEQALVETVIGVQQLRGSKEWGPEEIDKALSPEALTSAVMQRYHVYIACRREMGAKFGKLSASS